MTDCQRCGQCCTKSIIDEILEIDLRREPRLRPHVEPIRQTPGLDDAPRYSLKTPCPFLLHLTDGATHCTIYPTRPNICVAYEPGSSRICSQWKDNDEE